MANETNQYMSDSGYSPNVSSTEGYFDIHTNNGNLRYVPKKWSSNELIETVEMNNIEQGIQIALAQTSTIEETKNEALAQINAIRTELTQQINSAQTDIGNSINTINTNVSSALNTQNTNLISLLQQIVGTTDYDFNSLDYTRPNNLSPIDTRITQLYNEVFGINPSGSTSNTSLNARLTELTGNVNNLPSTIYSTIGERLGDAYYSNGSWTTINNQTGLQDVDTRITQLYNAIFGQSSSGSSKTILEQIEDLKTAIFGSSTGGSSSGSLIDKMEKAIGRTLDLEDNETIDQTTGNYSNSLTAQINAIKGVLGMSGGTSGSTSTLIQDVEMALNLLYGYTFVEEHEDPNDDTSPVVRTLVRNNAPDLNRLDIRSSYPTLYNDFYNTTLTYSNIDSNEPNATKTTNAGIIAILNSLGADFGKVATSAKTANTTINNYSNDLVNINKAYSKAFSTVIGEDTYLVLSPINQQAQEEEPASTVEQISEKQSTYVPLPKGGGGGIGSNYFTRIENITRPQNRNISIGDNFIYSFYWMAYQTIGNEIQQEEPYGEMRVSIDRTLVLTKTVDAGSKTLVDEEYEYDVSKIISVDLGQYIRTTGRKNISIVISAEGYTDAILSGYVVAYAPSLTIDLNTKQVFSGNSINFPYLATVGSNEVEKILYIEIDGILVSNNNITYLETSYTNASIETPTTDGGHLLTVYFKYRLDSNSPLLESSKYNYGIITNRSSSTQPYIITDLNSNIELTQYDQLSTTYMVYGALSETHNVLISILDVNDTVVYSEALEAINLTPPQNMWVHTFDEPGSFTLQFEVDGNENTRKSYNILVNLNQQYQFVLQRPSNLVLNLTPNGRSNQELATTRNKWENLATNPDQAHSNVEIEMNNFLFSDQNNYDGWLKDENNKPILRLRNTDEVKIKNCPLLRQADINTGLTLEIEFKTSDVVNLNTIFFEQLDAGLNIEQQQASITNKWDTEKQYRIDIENEYNSMYNNGQGEDYTTIYSEILNNLIAENNSLPEEQKQTQSELESQAEEQAKAQILELATEEIVGNNNRPYIDWTEDDYLNEYNRVSTEQSIILTPQSFTGNARAQTVLQYKEEELTTISYVFNPDNAGDDTLLIYCYINGILSNIKRYDQMLNQSTNSFIKIGSLECTTDIYAIRLYNVALNSREIVQNWIYGLSNINDKINAYVRNMYGDSTITDAVFAEHAKNTPYMVIRASGPLESSDAMPQAKGSKFATTVELRYVDPVNPENSFTSSDTSIQVQGTSSQYYPRKNYKLKMKNFTQNRVLHMPKNNGDETISTEGYKLFENSVPVFNFCIKADYASSEGVNNTGLARIYDDIVRNFYKTPAQQLDETNSIRQAVDGKPMVVFYEEGYINPDTNTMEYKTPYFLGKYNFNNDKGTHEIFGLETFQDNAKEVKNSQTGEKEIQSTGLPYIGDESWEGADNFYPLNIFVPLSIDGTRGYTKSTDLNTNDWKATFPARFPTVWEDYPEYADHTNWYEAIKWVYNTRTVVWKQDPITKLYYDAALDENDPDYYVGPEENKTREEVIQEHLQEFKTNFSNYFNLNAMLFFYCFTEFFLMVDNRAKNMFWTRYLTTANRNKDDVLAAGENNQTYDTYFSLPYDFDTAMGIDNQGMFQFNYNLESTDEFMPDGSLIFNGHPSIFWTNFIKVFEEEIGNTFRQLLDNSFENPLYPGDSRRNFRFDYNTIEKRFEDHQSAWSETIFNEDAIFKYIKAHANYFMAQGSKKEQRQWWLYNRFRYFTSKYRAGGISSTDNINIRAQAAGTIKVSTIADCYVTFQLGSDSGVIDSLDTKRALVNEGEVILTLPQITANNSVINIYPASAIRSISGLSSLSLQTVNFNAAKKIQYLTIGSNSVTNTSLTEINISENPLLRHLDVRNCRGFNAPLRLQICSSLETIYLAGTTMTSVVLPDGGILKTVQYPTSIVNITISNQPYLQNIIVGNYLSERDIAAGYEGNIIPQQIPSENYSNITTISLNNIAATNDAAQVIINSSNLNNCTLTDLEFTMSGEDFETLYNKLIAVRNINDEEHSIIGQVNISNCILYLTSDLPSTLTINEITSNFDFKIYTQNQEGEWVEYYNVRFYGFSGEYLLTKSVKKGSSVDGPKELFTEEYVKNYNHITNENMSEHPTMEDFDYWDKASLEDIDENSTDNQIAIIKNTIKNVNSDLDVFAQTATKYRADFISQTSNINVNNTEYRYFFVNEYVVGSTPLPFIRNYYKYSFNYWTDSPEDNPPPNVGSPRKKAEVEIFYAVYSEAYAEYNIYVYTTNDRGEKVGEPINKDSVIKKTVLGTNNIVLPNDINPFLPTHNTNGLQIVMSGDEEEIGIPDNERQYKYLITRPAVPTGGLRVTGDMDILITYYYDGTAENNGDVFTKYFLNKLIRLDLTGTSLTSLPDYSFNHNTELLYLNTNTYNIGDYSFLNFYEANKRKIFIFNNGANNITFGQRCFYDLNNALIVITGSGNMIIKDYSFNSMRDCVIIMIPPTNMVGNLEPIQAINPSSGFGNFIANNNLLYVPLNTYNLYPEQPYSSTYPNTPYNLISGQAKTNIRAIENYKSDVNTLLREAGLNDKQLN